MNKGVYRSYFHIGSIGFKIANSSLIKELNDPSFPNPEDIENGNN